MENRLGWLILFSTFALLLSQQVADITPDDKDVNDRPNASPPICISKNPVDGVVLLLRPPLESEAEAVSSASATAEPSPEVLLEMPSSSSDTASASASSSSSSSATDLVTREEGWFGNHTGERIMESYRTLELGKVMMPLAITGNLAVLALHTPPSSILFSLDLISNVLGFTAIFHGLLFREILPPRFASRIEQVGIALVLLASFGIVAANLPPYLVWIPFLCWLLTLLPLFLT